jgi:multidrug efflux pump subunit AcrA (membrane-fusion protein)
MRLGHEASVSTDAFPGRTFIGNVVRMAPLLRETSRQARVEIDIENRGLALKPGMFVQARIVFAEHAGATVVPVDALTRRDGRRGVFLVDTVKTTVSFVPVTVGIVEGERAEVLEPELSGLVVTLGQHLLENGSPVILPGGANRQTGAIR